MDGWSQEQQELLLDSLGGDELCELKLSELSQRRAESGGMSVGEARFGAHGEPSWRRTSGHD